MPKRTQTAICCTCLILSGSLSLRAETKSDAKWTIGAPIVTYWAGPGADKALTEPEAAQIRAGGWNLGWAQNVADLDMLHRHGMRGMLVFGTPNLDHASNNVAKHPITIETIISRERLRPRYGQAWQGRG